MLENSKNCGSLKFSALCYDVVTDHGTIRLLSKAGVLQCAAEMEKQGLYFHEEDVRFFNDSVDGNYTLFHAKVSLWKQLSGKLCKIATTIGSKRQWRLRILEQDCEEGWCGDVIADEFWFEKGSEKAFRNAKLKLIPEHTQNEVLSSVSGPVWKMPHLRLSAPNDEERVNYFCRFSRWRSEPLPFAVIVCNGKCKNHIRMSWQEMANLGADSQIETRSGKRVGVRQYWHILANYVHAKDPRLYSKAQAALRIWGDCQR